MAIDATTCWKKGNIKWGKLSNSIKVCSKSFANTASEIGDDYSIQKFNSRRIVVFSSCSAILETHFIPHPSQIRTCQWCLSNINNLS